MPWGHCQCHSLLPRCNGCGSCWWRASFNWNISVIVICYCYCNATRCFFFCLSLKLRRSLLLLCRRFHHTGAELWEHMLPVNHTVGKSVQFLEKGKVTWLLYAKSVYRWFWIRVCCLDSVDPLDLHVAARLPTRLPLSEPPSMLLPPAAGGQKWCCTLIRSGHQTGHQFYLVWLRWRFQDISRVFIFAHLQGEGL